MKRTFFLLVIVTSLITSQIFLSPALAQTPLPGNSASRLNEIRAFLNLFNLRLFGSGMFAAPQPVKDNSGLNDLVQDNSLQVNNSTSPVPCANNSAPIVTISGPSSGQVGASLNFSGAGSTDLGGQIVSYAWNFGDESTGSGALVSHAYTATGSYTITLTVTDNCGEPGSKTKTVTINALPIANAGPDQNGAVGTPVSLDGSASHDPDGQVVSYWWNFGDNSQATGWQPSAIASHIYTAADAYTATLWVKDNLGAVSTPNTTTVTITNLDPCVGNQEPTAAISGPSSGQTGSPLNFSGTGSTDSDGTITSYAWNFGDGSDNASGATVSHTYATADTYTVTLTVTDNCGATDTATVTVTITSLPINTPPQVNAGADQIITLPSGAVLDATVTDDGLPAGRLLSYAWTKESGPGTVNFSSPNTEDSQATFSLAGTYILKLTVTEILSGVPQLSGSDTVQITVNPANQPPIANAGPNQNGAVGATVSLNGSASTDPDGSIVSYWWNFGDGQSTGWQTSPFAEHIYTIAGTYTATLSVEDDGGAISSDTATITINIPDPCANNRAPTANAGFDQILTDTDNNGSELVTLNGVCSDEDNNLVSCVWTEGETTLATTGNAQVTLAVGSHNLKLTATDSCGAWTQPTVNVTVNTTNPGELNADFRVYRLVYVDPYTHEEQWFEVNLATEIVPLGAQLKFDSSASTGDIGFATWTMGDGTFETGTVVQHQYENGGIFPVELTIFDTTWQQSDTITKSVTGANSSMTFLDSLGLADDNSNDIVLYNNLAWTSHLNGKLTTINITDPANMVMLSSITAPSARAITYANNHLFLAGSTGGMHIYEATTPNPTSVGVYNTWSQDGQSVRDVYGQGKVVIMAAGPAGLKLLNVSSPGSPTVLGATPLPNNTSAEVLVVSNGKAYVADGSTKVHIYDLSGLNFNNPSAFTPTLLKTINVGWIVHQLAISDNTLIAQANPGGMFLYDVANPVSATQIGYFDIADEAVGQSPGGIVASGHYVYAGFGPVLGIGTSVAKVSLVNPANPYIAEWLSLSALSVSGTNRSPVLRNGVLYFANSMHRAATVGVTE